MSEKQAFSSFFVDDFLFGISVDRVQEIVGAVDMAPVPLAPEKVRGLINLRGQIIVAIDLRSCLQMSDRPSDQAPVNIILNSVNGSTSLLVDRIGEIIEVDEETFELSPETLRGPARELIRGAYKLENSLMHVLDLDRALDVSY